MDSKNQYEISFQCPNCGEIFKVAIQKGVTAKGRGGECPTCGVKDNTVGVGSFQVIRKNDDLQTRSYN